jgi:enoyl-[acyl-carrier-protein] reductase (NADH)
MYLNDLKVGSLKAPIFYILSIIVIVGCVLNCQRKERQAVKEVIDWDSKAISSLGVASHTQATNAHLLIQIINELNGESAQPKPLEKAFDLDNLSVDDDEQIEVSIDQLKRDVREIDQGIRAIASNNLFQRQSLEIILDRIRSKNVAAK